MWCLLLVSAAAAGAVPGSVLPLLESPAVEQAFTERALAQGTRGAGTTLACRSFAEALSLCFTMRDGERRRLVTRADLAGWQVDLSELEQVAVERAQASLGPERPQWVQVEGDSRRYLLSAEGDGMDQAAAFQPRQLVERFDGAQVALGLPARGVLIAFPLGDSELEHIVAVGIRRLWETLEDPITPLVYAWNGSGWVTWGQAKPGTTTAADPLERPSP